MTAAATPTTTTPTATTPRSSATPPAPGDRRAGGDYSRAQPGNNAAWDADDAAQERPDGDPAKVKDSGVLESIGKAISSPVIESEEDKSQTADKGKVR